MGATICLTDLRADFDSIKLRHDGHSDGSIG
jgi:hypothetical protein